MAAPGFKLSVFFGSTKDIERAQKLSCCTNIFSVRHPLTQLIFNIFKLQEKLVWFLLSQQLFLQVAPTKLRVTWVVTGTCVYRANQVGLKDGGNWRGKPG